MYADYTYYTEVFKGNLLTTENFDTYSVKASAYIDYITLKKAIKGITIPTFEKDIRMCTCALAEQYYKNEVEENRISDQKSKIEGNEVISSETIGKQSISYQKLDVDKRTQSERESEYNKLLKKVVYQYLAITGLLNRSLVCL